MTFIRFKVAIQNYFKTHWNNIIGIFGFQCTLRKLDKANVLTKALRKGQSFPVCLLETDLYCLPLPVPIMEMNAWPISCQFVVLGCWKHICPIVFHWDFCAAGVSFFRKDKVLKGENYWNSWSFLYAGVSCSLSDYEMYCLLLLILLFCKFWMGHQQ